MISKKLAKNIMKEYVSLKEKGAVGQTGSVTTSCFMCSVSKSLV